ncbi:MAG: hypothetical protein ACRDYB_02825 [Acidimicrobiales bacterium]
MENEAPEAPGDVVSGRLRQVELHLLGPDSVDRSPMELPEKLVGGVVAHLELALSP